MAMGHDAPHGRSEFSTGAMNAMRKPFLLLLSFLFLAWCFVRSVQGGRMAVDIVGSEAASITGAASISIPINASTAVNDDVYLFVQFKRAGGLDTSASTPAGFTLVANRGQARLYQRIYLSTPPASVTVNFGNTDVHALARSVTVRGFLANGSSSFRRLRQRYAQSTPSPYTISEQATEFDGTMILTFYGTSGASVTVPTEQTGLFATTATGPPALGIAGGHRTVLAAGTVAEESVTLSATTDFTLIQLTLVPATATSIFTPHWATPLGPYILNVICGEILFDPNTDHAWVLITATTGASLYADIRILKIVRSTFTIASDTTLTGYGAAFGRAAEQDANYLYLALEETPFSYVKVQKSDMTIVDTGSLVPNATQGTSTLRMGKAGTWSAGILWGIVYAASETLEYRLVGWDPTDGTVLHNVGITEGNIDGQPNYGWVHLAVDNNGDLWILSTRRTASGGFDDTAVLTQVTSGPTLGTPISLPNVYMANEGRDTSSLTYDPANHALIITGASQEVSVAERSNIARYNITAGTVTFRKNYGGLWISDASSLGVTGNGLRGFLGVPSVFTGWHDPVFDWFPASIVQYNHETGAIVRELEMQEGYDYPNNLVLSPEGELWMTSGSGAFNTGPDEYIHKLDILSALGGESAIDPYILTYGTRWGLGMGLS